MKKLPIDLPVKSVTTKVSPEAWERAQQLKDKFGARLSDVLSACLLYMPEEKLKKILQDQNEAVNNLPKSVIGTMRNIDKLSDEEKQMLRDILG